MNAPMLWIILPGVGGVLLFFLRDFPRFMRSLGVLLGVWLWLTAAMLPIGEVISLGGRVFIVSESLSFLGREFIFVNSDGPLLAFLFLAHLVWIIGAIPAHAQKEFIPFSFVIVALLTAALAVEPFLYAALLIEIAVLISVPILSPPDQKPGKGIFRFLAFQTLGMPFILISGRFLAGLEASPGQTEFVLRAGVFIGIGFAFLLAVVPFHSWIPSLAEESEPYTVAFILFLLPMLITVFGLGFIDRFIWLRGNPEFYQGLQLIGVLMVVVGGLWAALETHLGRMMGFAAIAENGISLLAIGVASSDGILLFFWLVVVRLFSVVIWAAALTYFKQKTEGELSMSNLHGVGYLHPLVSIGILVGQFSLFGLPFLAGFSSRVALWRLLSPVSPAASAMALLGTTGLMMGTIRTLNALFVSLPEGDEGASRDSFAGIVGQDGKLISERLLEWVLFGLYVALLSILGLFPTVYLPALERVLLIFNQIGGG
jgi:NADH:ubiquinone oxidoreductase subunit 2 (subunit N)